MSERAMIQGRGEMVEARVGMVVEFSEYGIQAIINENDLAFDDELDRENDFTVNPVATAAEEKPVNDGDNIDNMMPNLIVNQLSSATSECAQGEPILPNAQSKPPVAPKIKLTEKLPFLS